MAYKVNIDAFLRKSPEEQAKEIEKQTKELLKRLPTLKKQLKMYGDVSSEMYNLTSDEVSLMGSSYASAVRGGEITAPSSKQAYRQFIKNLHKYTKTNMALLAQETASQRMESWIEHINEGSTDADSQYANELLNSMTDEEKLGFTRSKFFMDSTYMYMVTEEDGKEYSIQTLKLELFLEEVRGKTTRHIYRRNVKQSDDKLRKYKKPK